MDLDQPCKGASRVARSRHVSRPTLGAVFAPLQLSIRTASARVDRHHEVPNCPSRPDIWRRLLQPVFFLVVVSQVVRKRSIAVQDAACEIFSSLDNVYSSPLLADVAGAEGNADLNEANAEEAAIKINGA